MKILQVISSLGGGGAERIVSQLAPLVNRKGNQCDVLTLSGRGRNAVYLEELRAKGVRVFVAPYKNRYDPRFLAFVAALVNRGHYDVVHAHTFPAIYWVSLAARLFRRSVSTIMTEHSTSNNRRGKPGLRRIERFVYGQYDEVISISQDAQRLLMQWVAPRDTSKYSVIDNGICVSEFSNAKPLARESLGIPSDVCLVGVAGTFSHQKNQAALLRALPLLPNNVHVMLVGDGPLRNDCAELAISLGVNDRAHFLGYRRDIARVLQTVDIVVVPSLWEGFGLVAVEAMACGKPLIAANVPGLREVVTGYGVLCDPEDETDIAKKLVWMLADSEAFGQCAAAGLLRAAQYRVEEMAANYLAIYENQIDVKPV